MEITVTLPWPPAECSPNWRGHWAKRRDAVNAGKWIAHSRTQNWLTDKGIFIVNDLGFFMKRLSANYILRPPDRRRRDIDNFVARCKPFLDGICTALGIDDFQIKRTTAEWGEVVKGGEVEITIGVIEESEDDEKEQKYAT